jgi:hypothetical protein
MGAAQYVSISGKEYQYRVFGGRCEHGRNKRWFRRHTTATAAWHYCYYYECRREETTPPFPLNILTTCARQHHYKLI